MFQVVLYRFYQFINFYKIEFCVFNYNYVFEIMSQRICVCGVGGVEVVIILRNIDNVSYLKFCFLEFFDKIFFGVGQIILMIKCMVGECEQGCSVGFDEKFIIMDCVDNFCICNG